MKKNLLSLFFLLFLFQLVAAAVCGPYSCEWGNGLYFAIGLVSMLVIVIVMLSQKAWDLLKRLAYAALFTFLSIVVWLTGFLLGDFSILCRLF